ncbi:MAG: hypothetical protein KJZ91_29020 [Myxococcales bacterium]|nr:hypothetical protein [Myxococcales bacterium]
MTARPPPGVELASGRVRVDAGRAIAKLREYRLADPFAWILEAIRAAVASGATHIAVDGDANDVWLRWEGRPWPTAELPTLLDELVSPEPARDAYHRRLLAAAVNSALGLEPAWVDVVASDGQTAARVRFTPEALEAGADGAAPLQRLAVTACPPPAELAGAGVVVHLRRPAGLDTLWRFLRRDEPPEVHTAYFACRDIAVPTVVGGDRVGRDRAAHDLLRMPLGENLDGFVALVHPMTAERATFAVAELGVEVVREPWRSPALPAQAVHGPPPPLRVLVDGPRMPTNASRSQVREDAHPIAAARRQAERKTVELLAELARRLAEAPAGAEPAERRELRAAALALLASAIAGDDWQDRIASLPPALAPLARLPLLQNAVGAWRAPAAPWSGIAYQGDEPLAVELAPWLDTMPWLRPESPERLLLGDAVPDAGAERRMIRAARRRRQARARFLGLPTREARVPRRASSRVRARLGAGPRGSAPDDAFTGLAGEVCVAAAPGPGRLTLLHDERAIVSVTLDVPAAIDAVVGGAPLVPDERYRGVAVDDGYHRAERAARLAAIRAIEALCDDDDHDGVERGEPRWRPEDRALVVAALQMARDLDLTIDDDAPLARAAIWPTADGQRLGLAGLRRERVLAVAEPDLDVVAPPGRVLVRIPRAERAVLRGHLGGATLVVPYGAASARPALDPAMTLARRLVERTGRATLARRADGAGGAITFGGAGASTASTSSIEVYHRGQRLGVIARQPAHFDCEIAVDSEAVVPDDAWLTARDATAVTDLDLAAWERELARAVTRALLGHVDPELLLPQRPLRLDDPSGRALCEALARTSPRKLLADRLLRSLRAHPLLTVMGHDARVSIDELVAAFRDGPIPALGHAAAATARELGDWRPLVAGETVRRMVAAVTGRAVVDAADQLDRRHAEAARARRLAEHRTRPVEPLELPAACAPVALGKGLRGVVGLGDDDRLDAVVLLEGRRLSVVTSAPDLPLRAVVAIGEADLDDGARALRPTTRARIVSEAQASGGRVLAELARVAPARLHDDPAARRLLAAWFAVHRPGDHEVRAAVRAAPAWPTIQGARASITAATHGRALAIAAWRGTWLAGDPADPLDAPVLALPPDLAGEALRKLLTELGPGSVEDVTARVTRLQAQRRVARGVVPAPTIPGAAPELTRRLDELGETHGLGPGEIGFVDEPGSRLLLHVDGEHRADLPLEVVPPVAIAIEAPDLVAELARPGGLAAAHRERLARDVGRLAVALVQRAVGADRTTPPWVRRRLRAAVLSGRLDPRQVSGAPLFDTVSGKPARWRAIVDQDRRFGAVWYVVDEPAGQPLDRARIVLRLTPDEARLAANLTAVTMVNAANELRLDARTRENRGRAPRTRLALPPEVRAAALDVVELDRGARRGVMALLHPRAARARGVHASRGQHPYDVMPDPCPWPTHTVVEDPSLTDDRTASRPLFDEPWHALSRYLVATATAALERVVAAPPGVSSPVTISAWPDEALAGLPVTGALWRGGDRPGVVEVVTEDGTIEVTSPEQAPFSGRLFVAPAPRDLRAAVAALCRHHGPDPGPGLRWHARPTPAAPPPDPSPAPASPTAARAANPSPTSARPASSSPAPTPVTPPVARPGEEGAFDVRARLADRARVSEEKAALAERMRRFEEARERADAPPPPPHPLEALALALDERLGRTIPVRHYGRLTIAPDRRAPLARVHEDRLVLAGASRPLRHLAEALAARAPWASAGVDALAAHAMTLLNLVHERVTDRHEAETLVTWMNARR